MGNQWMEWDSRIACFQIAFLDKPARWIFVLDFFQSFQVVLQGAAAHEVEQGREYDILQAPLREIEDLVR